MIAVVLTAMLLADPAESVQPSLTQAIVYPQGPYWGVWSGDVSPQQPTLQLPASILEETCEAKTEPPVAFYWQRDPHDLARTSPMLATVGTPEGRWTGLAMETASGLRLDQGRAVRYLAADQIQTVRWFAPVRLQFRLQQSDPKVSVRAEGFACGLTWEPEYRIYLGAENSARFRMAARLLNLQSNAVDCPNVQLAVAQPEGTSANSVFDGSNYEWGPVKLGPQQSVSKSLLDGQAAATERVIWKVGQVAVVGAESVREDQLISRLQITPPDEAQSLPAGSAVIFQGERPMARSTLPFVERGQSASIELGLPSGIRVNREETELERKQSAIQRENEYYDWVRLTGVLTIENVRPTAVEMTVIKTFEGEGTAASDDGAIVRQPNVVGDREALTEIRWELTVPAGEKRRLTYGYLLHLKAE